MNLIGRVSRPGVALRARSSLAPSPTAHAESEQHESGHEPAAGGFQLRVGQNIFLGQNVEPGESRAAEK